MPKLRWYSAALAAALVACSTAELKTPPGGVGPAPGAPANPAEDEEPDAPAGGKAKPAADDGGDADGGPVPTPQPVELRMSTAVTIQVQPADAGAAVLAAIKAARTSIHMTMYLLTDEKIIDALGDAKDAGRDVKVVLNRTFPTNGGSNLAAYDALTRRGVDVVWAPASYRYTHAKTIVLDGEKAIIMTMNLTASSARTNREYIATDADPDDVADLERIFAADHAGEALTLASKLVLSPDGTNSNGAPRDVLRSFIDSARTSLDVEVQTLSDRSLVDGILAAHAAGKDVHVVIDGDVSTTNAQLTVIAKLKAAGVPLRSLKTPDLHAKIVVVDGARVFVGSQNFTATALDDNREVGLLTDVPAEVAKAKTQIASDFAKGVEL